MRRDNNNYERLLEGFKYSVWNERGDVILVLLPYMINSTKHVFQEEGCALGRIQKQIELFSNRLFSHLESELSLF